MNKFSIFFFSCLLTLLFPACSKKAPEPPRVRSELTLSIFRDLQREDYDSALAGITKLSQLNDRDSFLPVMQAAIESNRVISHAEKLLAEGKRKEAERVISDAAAEHGQSVQLSAARKKVSDLAEMESLLETMKSARSSDQLRNAALRFKQLAQQNSCKGVFLSYPDQKLRDAEKMKYREMLITALDLDCDHFELARENAVGAIRAQIRLLSEQTASQNVYKQKK